jgi:hypothetical protein
MHSWLRHKSITGTAVNTALAANRFKDFWGELAKALKIGRGVGVSGVGSTRDRRASERELGKLVEVAVSAGAGPCRRRPDERQDIGCGVSRDAALRRTATERTNRTRVDVGAAS